MKLQPLYDLQQDINRLFVAGSKFAKGDPRLTKHIAVFNKLGEKVPVFKKLAVDLEDLTQADTSQSAEKLTSISILLYSILYTQGETIEEEAIPQERNIAFALKDVSTDRSYIQLKPVIQALTVSNSGRMEVVKDAAEQGVFSDFRTYQYLNLALADKYSELAEYVSEVIRTKVGAPMIPFLLHSFKYEDKTEQVRRLALLNKLAYPCFDEMADKILNENLPNLQAEVVRYLSGDPKNEELLIRLSDDKNHVVREAAYMALAQLNTKTSLDKLSTAYIKNKTKANLSSIVKAMAKTNLPFFFDKALDNLKTSVNEFLNLDASTGEKDLNAGIERVSVELELLKNKDRAEVYTFLKDFLLDKRLYNVIMLVEKKCTYSYVITNAFENILAVLRTLDKKKVLAFYIDIVPQLKAPKSHWVGSFWKEYFRACVADGYSKEQLFDLFNESYSNAYIAPYDLLCTSLGEDPNRAQEPESTFSGDHLDVRWVDLLYNTLQSKHWESHYVEVISILNKLEPRPSQRFNQLLIDKLPKTKSYMALASFKYLMHREVPNRFELIFSEVKNITYAYPFNSLNDTGFWNRFPKEYGAKFRALYDKNKVQFFEDIANEIENNNQQ